MYKLNRLDAKLADGNEILPPAVAARETAETGGFLHHMIRYPLQHQAAAAQLDLDA